jgi:pimeloyl-ACP methyl ester carboxylesterase|tara:strand:- start:388 stop:1140 length:753 start_codon:yes stop_codon:yes gene_type:complete
VPHSDLISAQGRRLAYQRINGEGPEIVFLSGFKSDMEGTKALHLAHWAALNGRSFLRFDYSGHGQSSGMFGDGCIGDWLADAEAVITRLTEGPVILVGSSMGGWICLLLSKRLGARLVGLVTIAAAPDFTEDIIWAGFDADQRSELKRNGQVALPSDYDEPYVITQRLIEDGRQNLVLRSPLALPCSVRFLQGTADVDVNMSVALRLLAHASAPDMQLTLVDGADHRFSDERCLGLIEHALIDVLALRLL